MAPTLHLLVPGLLATGRFGFANPAVPVPAAPALRWLLARGDARPASATTDATLFRLFDAPVPEAADLPVAAVSRLADGGEPDDGWWLRTDPVHLRPDLHGVLLVDARALAIEPVEAALLAAAFDQTFAADGLQLHVPRPDRWYLRLPADPGLRTHPLVDAIGRDINPLLPHGPASGRWHALLTEIQMLFHQHPINRAREARNQPLINSVWFWGGGRCPAGARAPAADLYANDPLTRGLARLTNATVGPVPEHADDWLDGASGEPDSLVVLETMRYDLAEDDPARWADHVAELERTWFSGCRRWLQTGRLATLHLYPGDGRVYTVTGAARWRFWRRSRPLVDDPR
ncbi:MAG: hypothetical protein P9F19_03845 [Candidatus Contendobacter sp.]|nr:hypothetical protein [Candidatus Contendobacter sp.]MDG4556517.1 hypothetical protein [Candidatus Contendobacter sp.]